jgi:tetratricopeptide (TPR) repeat protein
MSPRPSRSPLPAAHAPTRFQVPTGWLCLLLFVAVIVAFFPALSAGFIWDDNGHVTRADLRSLGGLGRIWFEMGATQQYYPLLHSAFWLEHRLWGDHALGYHLLNLLLHATAAGLFATLLRRLAVPGAALAAFLFALHPVCVESVAWISEQKNTLSAVLYLCAALAFLRYAREDGTENRPAAGTPARLTWYAIASVLFVAALLTKTVTATLPAALWVILWWRHGRLDWRRDILPLLPWLVIGAASGLFTAHFERVLIGARGADFALGGLERCLLAGRVFWFYLGKLVWPAHLIFIYPRWTIDASDVDQWLGLVTAVALLAALGWCAAGRRSGAQPFAVDRGPSASPRPLAIATAVPPTARVCRGVLAALLLFAGTLFPVLGFFDIYPFRHSYVADHFQYLASLAIFALAGAGLELVRQHWANGGRLAAPSLPPTPAATAHGRDRSPSRSGSRSWWWAFRVLPVAIICVLSVLTFRQTRMYRDVFTLYETTLARNPNTWLAHNNLGIALADDGRVNEAIAHYEAALKLKPGFPQAENNLGDCLIRLGRAAEAIPHFERALQLEPHYPVARRNLGMALAMSGRTDEAVAQFAAAVKLEPTYAEAELYWAVALAQTGRSAEAIPHFARVLQLDPSSGDAHLGLAQALRALGRTDEAQSHFEAARQLGVRP